MILGSQLGIWCAFFSHFVLRDLIFRHFTRLTHKASTPIETGKQALRYIGTASCITLLSVAVTCIIGAIMSTTGSIKQEWLVNLSTVCGESYSVDENTGLLIPNINGMYYGTMVTYTNIFGILGLYIGQVLFRLDGYRLGFDAYTSKRIWH